jgi:hypothetical protein
MALIALAAHYSLIEAFSRAEISAIAPFEYSALVWAVALGYLSGWKSPAFMSGRAR